MQLVSGPLERSQIVAQGPGNGLFEGEFERFLTFFQGNTRILNYGNGAEECQLAFGRQVPAKHARLVELALPCDFGIARGRRDATWNVTRCGSAVARGESSWNR